MSRIALSALASLLALAAGCSCSSSTGARHDGGPEGPDGNGADLGGLSDTAIVVPDTGTPEPDVGNDAYVDRTTFCMGRGPAVIVGDSSMTTATCAGAIASRVFSSSICACTDANVVGYLRTRSFDSMMSTMDMDTGAPVGVDQHYTTGGYADVGGSFTVAGASGVTFGGYLDVAGDARFGGNVDAASYIHIHRDFWVEGNVTNIGYLQIDRDLHQPTGHTLLTFPSIGGRTVHTPFTVDPPCDCSPSGLVDIAAIVDYGRAHNDNADVMLDPGALSNVIGIGVDLTLPCGRFYVNSIGGAGSITLHVHGRTALYVGGPVDALGVLNVDLGTEGELDVFIAGDLVSIGAGSWGDRSRPAASRIYVGGTGDVTLVGASGFVGNVYAPHARITAVGATTVYGSLFGGRIDMPGYLDVHYDRAILDVDADCPPPPGCSCSPGATCTDHSACIGGACTGCTTDADCCAPLVCYPGGHCGALLL
jgi:hypothetical protein